MALRIVISRRFSNTLNVLSLLLSERESGKWPLRLNDFHRNYLISNDCIQDFGKIFICNT